MHVSIHSILGTFVLSAAAGVWFYASLLRARLTQITRELAELNFAYHETVFARAKAETDLAAERQISDMLREKNLALVKDNARLVRKSEGPK